MTEKTEKKDLMEAIVDNLMEEAKNDDDGVDSIADLIGSHLEHSEKFQNKLLDRVLAEPELKEKVIEKVMNEISD